MLIKGLCRPPGERPLAFRVSQLQTSAGPSGTPLEAGETDTARRLPLRRGGCLVGGWVGRAAMCGCLTQVETSRLHNITSSSHLIAGIITRRECSRDGLKGPGRRLPPRWLMFVYFVIYRGVIAIDGPPVRCGRLAARATSKSKEKQGLALKHGPVFVE